MGEPRSFTSTQVVPLGVGVGGPGAVGLRQEQELPEAWLGGSLEGVREPAPPRCLVLGPPLDW